MKKGSSGVEQTGRAECGQRIVNVLEGLMHNPVKDGMPGLVNNRWLNICKLVMQKKKEKAFDKKKTGW